MPNLRSICRSSLSRDHSVLLGLFFVGLFCAGGFIGCGQRHVCHIGGVVGLAQIARPFGALLQRGAVVLQPVIAILQQFERVIGNDAGAAYNVKVEGSGTYGTATS